MKPHQACFKGKPTYVVYWALHAHEGGMLRCAHTEREVRWIGCEFGHDLAAALILASGRGKADRALKRQMAQIVLDQIDAAVRRLQSAGFPANLVDVYERGARAGVREELRNRAAPQHRSAA